MTSELEKSRIANIQRNNEYLIELGLSTISVKQRVGTSTKKSTKKRARVEADQPTRRSSRVASLSPVNYKEQEVVSLLFVIFLLSLYYRGLLRKMYLREKVMTTYQRLMTSRMEFLSE
jgi:hypothetical protein